MKKILFLIHFCFAVLSVTAQNRDSIPKFSHNIQAYSYFRKDDFLFSPMYTGDKGKLHLEARYNYENRETFSAWIGYNFEGGKKWHYVITPEIGGVVGKTDGIAPGLKLDFSYKKFSLVSESEFVFDLNNSENDFYYNWTDLYYTPINWFRFGLSTQRTKVIQTDLNFQHGFMLGTNYKWLDVLAYFYNPGSSNKYFVLAFSANF